MTWGILYAPLTIPVATRLEEGEGSSWLFRLYFDAAGLATILAAAWLLARLVDRRDPPSLGFAWRSLPRESALGTGIALAMVSICLAVSWLGGWLEPVAAPDVAGRLLALAAISMLLNAALQEVLCRGYIFRTVERHGGATAAVVSTSLLFVALHAGAIQGSVLAASNLLAAGVLLGLTRAWTGNLWAAIALHFVWNVSLGPVLGLSVSGQALDVGHRLVRLSGPELWTGGAFGIEASLGAGLATLVGIGLLWSGTRRSRRSAAP